ncbi:MAG: hypothetical protein ACRCY3_12630 [Sphingorhabdus sp.]
MNQQDNGRPIAGTPITDAASATAPESPGGSGSDYASNADLRTEDDDEEARGNEVGRASNQQGQLPGQGPDSLSVDNDPSRVGGAPIGVDSMDDDRDGGMENDGTMSSAMGGAGSMTGSGMSDEDMDDEDMDDEDMSEDDMEDEDDVLGKTDFPKTDEIESDLEDEEDDEAEEAEYGAGTAERNPQYTPSE